MNKVNYVEPEIQVVEVEVEKGFAASGNEGQYTPIPGQPEGGDSF